jgi:hypothetical protein
LFLILGFYSYSQEYKIENEELKSSVKSLDLFSVSDAKKEIPIELKTFDSKGRISVSKTYYDGRINTTERNQYLNNQIIRELCDYCDDIDKAFANFSIKENQKSPYSGYVTTDPKRTFKSIKTTDKKGNVILSKTYNNEGYLIWETKSTYDRNSNLLLEETFDDEGKKEPEFKKNTYNKKGLLIEATNVMSNFVKKTVYEYDYLNRKKVEKEWHGERFNEYIYEYKKDKDTAKILKYFKNPQDNSLKIRTIEITYFEKDKKIIRITATYNGKINFIQYFEYDTQNKLLSKKYYNGKNELRTETILVYDKMGNWVEMNVSNLINTSYNGSEPKPEWTTNTYIRKIEYN